MISLINTNHLKKLSKVILSLVSIVLIIFLYIQVDFSKILELLKTLKDSKSLIVYILLALMSLIARAERFIIVSKKDSYQNITKIRLLILAATSIRNLSMSVVPFRLGELSIPLILKMNDKEEGITQNIHPIWISVLFDFTALLILSLILLVSILFFEPLAISNLNFSSTQFSILVITLSLTIASMLLFPFFLKKFSDKKLFQFTKKKIPLINSSSDEIFSKIPDLSFSLNFRILSLSLLIRVSKYMSLTLLFYSLNNDLIPNFINSFFISVSFISAELFSTLPGSGIMGFGGYEVVFTYCIKSLVFYSANTINVIAAIHLLGLLVELALAAIIIPLGLIGTRRSFLVGK